MSRFLQRVYYPWVSALMRRRALSIGLAVLAVASCVPVATRLGSEFMPPLNEGDILYMPSSWPTISIGEASRLMQIQDRLLKAYPEVASVHGKAGRAETATDPAPMEMFETVVRLKPVSEWRTVSRPRWYSPWAPEGLARVLRPLWSDRRPLRMEELVAALDEDVRIPGAPNVWTRPIQNRIDMNATGIRTAVGVKIFGSDAVAIERVAEEVERVLRDVPGTRSVVVERPARGMYLDIEPDRAALARLGLNLDALWETVETAIGGMPVTEVIQGRERFTVNLRLPREHRDSVEALRRVLIPVPARPAADAMAGGPAAARVALSQVARVTLRPGPAMVRNEDGGRTGWIYVDIADRDLGGYVEAARRAVRERVENAGLLPAGMHIAWAGQYEFLLRVRERLKVVVPLTLALIFLLLQLNFKSLPATLLVLVSVPFALTGSVWILFWLDYHVSVAVWIGIIALAGLAAQTGIVMLVYLEEAHRLYQRAGRLRTQHDLFECITYGAVQRVRPKVMTVTTTLLGLAPLLWSEGTGADVMKRIAAPMAGGLISSFFLTLELIPALYSLWRGRGVQWVPGRPPRKSWDELSGIFHQLEAEEALRYLSPDARGATPSPPSAGAPTRTQEIP